MDTEQRTGPAQPGVGGTERPGGTDHAGGTEQPAILEWGGLPGSGGDVGALTRGAGFACAVAGFALLIAAQALPWISLRTSPVQQDFPTASGGHLQRGLAELVIPTDIFNLGWLVVLGAVATALAVRPPARRVVVAAGLGLVAGQLALLVGMTRGIQHSSILRSTFPAPEPQVQFEAGLYSAYAALALFAAALLLAGGVRARLRQPVAPADEPAPAGPADLTVTPVPAADPHVWSRSGGHIEVGGQPPAR